MGLITIVGSINADLTAQVHRHPTPGETLLGTTATVSAGGKGANQAVAAALLGAKVAMVSAVGRDAYAGPATAQLRSSGVDLRGVKEVDGPTGLAIITVADDGENSIIVIPGANATVDANYVDSQRAVIADADIVVLQGEIPADGFARAVALASGRVVINLAPVIDVDRDRLLVADPLIANEHEAGLILDQLGVPHPNDAPAVLINQLREAGFSSVVLTLGAAGALVSDSTGLTPIPTPSITPVDTTGAGDAFTGALVARLAAGDSLADAAAFAARVGAFAATGPGAQSSYPHASDPLPEV